MDAAHASAELSFLLHERFCRQGYAIGYATGAAARHPATLNSQPSTLTSLLADLRLAFRHLAKAPGFTATVVVTQSGPIGALLRMALLPKSAT